MLPRILIVDDEENQRRALAIGLRLQGFEVCEASDGEQALTLLEQRSADLAVIDLMIPGINGLELARRLRTRRPDVRLVLTSAYHLSERQLARAGLGPIAFLPKPFDLDDLTEVLRHKLVDGAADPSAA